MLIPYCSVRTPCRKETEIKKSIFIAQLFPVETEEKAQSILENVRKDHKDAAHHCWAWRIGTVRIHEKSSDDGEPQGTAGHPMLHVLQMKSLTNTLAVVTRYFGGIKLGTGGLARAYGGTLAEAVEEAVEEADILCFTPHVHMELTIPYTAAGTFEHYIKGTDIRVLDRIFAEEVQITCLCLPENKARHEMYFRDMTGGKVKVEDRGEEYVGMETEEKE